MQSGQQMHELVSRLFPIYRSLTGNGVRETVAVLQEFLPELKGHEVPTGTQCFDWEIPREWNVNEAYIVDPSGNRICDIADNNLHLVGYSVPMRATMTLTELLPHLHSLPQQPDAIPYVTSYYKEYWGFCIAEKQKQELAEGEYQVVIDSELSAGSLTYAEWYVPGESTDEVLVSTYICHPSMANDQLSGPVVAAFAANWVAQSKRRLSYRFVFVPETIGSIAFLSRRHMHLKKHVVAGFNLSCIGDDRAYSVVESRKGNTLADRMANHVLAHTDSHFKKYSFLDRGSDEQQYCSPGIDLPLCTLSRSKFGEYPEYHTSLDDLSLVTPTGLEGGLKLLVNCLQGLEENRTYRLKTACEPQLGKRGLYPSLSVRGNGETVRDLTNFLAYCDGSETLLDIAERLGRPIWSFYESIESLKQNDLIESIDELIVRRSNGRDS